MAAMVQVQAVRFCLSIAAPNRSLLPANRRVVPQPGSSVRRGRGCRLPARATSQQQERQQGPGFPPPPSSPPPPRHQPGSLIDFVPRATRDYDLYVEHAMKAIEQGEATARDMDARLQEMARKDVPMWFINCLHWIHGRNNETLAIARKRHASLVEKRERFIAGLRVLAAELQEQPPLVPFDDATADWMVLAVFNWAIQEGQDDTPEGLQRVLREALEQTNSPNSVVWATVMTCMAVGYGMAWAGTWWGIDAYRQLHEYPELGASAASWLAWTAPYVGGTLAVYALAPPLVTKSILRKISIDQQQFYRKVPAPSFVFAAFVVAFCQCLVWQGLWQEVFFGWLGGSRDPLLLTDPAALEDSVRMSMGTLVGSPRLPAFLVAPAAALLTGLLEGGLYWSVLWARNKSAYFAFIDSSVDEPEGQVLELRLGEPSVLTPEEMPMVAARVALSGSYLALEATLTGNLWLSVGTSLAGLVTAILLSRRGTA